MKSRSTSKREGEFLHNLNSGLRISWDSIYRGGHSSLQSFAFREGQSMTLPAMAKASNRKRGRWERGSGNINQRWTTINLKVLKLHYNCFHMLSRRVICQRITWMYLCFWLGSDTIDFFILLMLLTSSSCLSLFYTVVCDILNTGQLFN